MEEEPPKPFRLPTQDEADVWRAEMRERLKAIEARKRTAAKEHKRNHRSSRAQGTQIRS